MSAGFAGFVVGAAVVAATTELLRQRHRLRRPPMAIEPTTVADDGGTAPRRPFVWRVEGLRLSRAEWEQIIPPPRSALRPRWESSGDWGDDDDWLADLFIGVTATLLAVFSVASASSLVPFATFFLIGVSVALVVLAGVGWARGRRYPPGGRQTIVRSAAVIVLAWIMIAWTSHTTYKSLSRADLRETLLAVPFTERPSVLTETYHGSGWGLTATLILGTLVAIALICRAMIDLASLVAITRLAEGSQSTATAWVGQLYRRRPARLWVTSAIACVAGFILCGGVALGWWDRLQRDDDPVTPPAVTSTTTSSVPPSP